MKITNKTGLSQPLYDAIVKVNSKYSKGDADFSATELINTPRIRILTQKHFAELEEDASDLIWRFMGHIVHEVLASMDSKNALSEERLYITIDNKVISGCPDRYENGILSDYKFTSKYAIKDGIKEEWAAQLNIYCLLLSFNGFFVEKAQVESILKDAVRDEPKAKILNCLIWPKQETTDYIKKRIRLHLEAEKELPLCTDEERWHVPDKWALMKKGRKTAVKLYDSLNMADAGMKVANQQPKANGLYYVEYRAGVDKRCADYCAVSKFCDQHKESKK